MLDCITDAESVPFCYAVIGRTGGRYACLELCPEHLKTRKAVKADFVMALDIYGKGVALDRGYGRDPRPEIHAAGVEWFRMAQRLLDEGRIKPHPIRVVDGRFEGILKGLQILKNGEVSGEKLVVFVS